MTKSIFENVRELIGSGEIQLAITTLKKYGFENNQIDEHQVLLLKEAELSRVKSDTYKGVITRDEENKLINKIVFDIILILNNLENKKIREEPRAIQNNDEQLTISYLISKRYELADSIQLIDILSTLGNTLFNGIVESKLKIEFFETAKKPSKSIFGFSLGTDLVYPTFTIDQKIYNNASDLSKIRKSKYFKEKQVGLISKNTEYYFDMELLFRDVVTDLQVCGVVQKQYPMYYLTKLGAKVYSEIKMTYKF